MKYKRLFAQNGYVHIIIVSYKRKNIFIDKIKILKDALKNSKKFFKFEIVAICILPDHIHMILYPKKIEEYPKIITSIKYYFSKNCDVGVETPTYGYTHKGEKGIFQRRYFEHTIKNEEELINQINYIHYNPVKHSYSDNVKDWAFSSFHKFVKQGLYDNNWGSLNDIEQIKNLNFE